MDKRTVIAAALAAVIFGALGFGAATLLTRGGGGAAGARAGVFRTTGQNGARMTAPVGRNIAVGKVTEKSGDSFTVKMPDGSSRTVYFSKSTTFSKTETATIADVSVGTTVTAMGQSTDGGVTAQRVQIGGDFGGMRVFGGGATGGVTGNRRNQDGGGFPDGGMGGPPPGFDGPPQ